MLAREALSLEYHPRHCIHTGKLVAVEAALQWPHRLSAALAVTSSSAPLDRQPSRLIGAWLLQAACAEAATWERPDLRLSIKLLGSQLNSEELCLQLSSVLEETGLASECLELALPEAFAFSLDEDAAIAFASLRDIGVNLLLDEFGHVFASLVALRDMPLTAMKVDRLMLRSLPSDEQNLAIIRAAIETSHAFGLKVCADSVDSEAHRAALKSLDIDEGQGHAFSPPLSPAELRDYLRRA